MVEIITRYTGLFRQASFQLNGDGDNLQIAIRNHDTGEIEVIFTGSKFSPEEFKKSGGQEKEDRYFSDFKISGKKA